MRWISWVLWQSFEYVFLTLGLAVLIGLPLVSIGAMHAIPFALLFSSWAATIFSVPRREDSAVQACVGAIVALAGLLYIMLDHPCLTARITTPVFTAIQVIWAIVAIRQYDAGTRD